MAAKDSLVIDSVFGGAHQDKHSSATLQRDQKQRKAKKGATFPTLKKITVFLQHLTNLFVEFAKTVQSFNRILVSLVGLILLAAILAFIVKAIWLGEPLPIESILLTIVRLCFSRIR